MITTVSCISIVFQTQCLYNNEVDQILSGCQKLWTISAMTFSGITEQNGHASVRALYKEVLGEILSIYKFEKW